MQRFVEAYVDNGGQGAEAARTAGYSDASARQRAYELIQKPEVHRAIEDLSRKRIAAGAPGALDCLAWLMKNATNESVRLNAAARWLEFGGYKPSEKHEHVFKDERTDEELDATIRALAEELESRH